MEIGLGLKDCIFVYLVFVCIFLGPYGHMRLFAFQFGVCASIPVHSLRTMHKRVTWGAC